MAQGFGKNEEEAGSMAMYFLERAGVGLEEYARTLAMLISGDADVDAAVIARLRALRW